jgi:hypothetical protein
MNYSFKAFVPISISHCPMCPIMVFPRSMHRTSCPTRAWWISAGSRTRPTSNLGRASSAVASGSASRTTT